MDRGRPAVKIEGLVKRYRTKVALDGRECVAPSGAITGLLGPNGAGKTTMVRSVLGLTRVNSGRIEVLGSEVPKSLPEITKSIGAIIEEPGLIRALSGRVNLQVAADQLGFGHDRIDELLTMVGLREDAKRRIDQYSKGMRQRLALAAALLGDPKLLILDEPLDGLDPAGQMAFRALLRDLADRGRSVVVSSHDMADIEALADYVIVINRGKLVTQGPLEDLLDGGDTRVVTSRVTEAETVLRGAGIEFESDSGAIRVHEPDGSRIIELLATAGIYPQEVSPARSSLESVFLGMTGEDGP